MIKGTPYQGRDRIIAPRVYIAGLQLVLYCNALNSLDDSSLYSALVQPTGTGYAPITLNGVYASANGIVTYDHGTPDDPFWQNTHATLNWSQPVTGAAIIGGAGPYLLHFMDNPNGAITVTPQRKISVNLSTIVSP